MAGSRTDRLYRSVLLSKFFTKGWGKPEHLKRIFQFRRIIADRDKCITLVDPNHPVSIVKESRASDHTVVEGEFESPFAAHCGDLLPPEARRAQFQLLLPRQWRRDSLRPTVIHLAGTGDHYYWRRRSLLAQPLLRRDCIASIILENPFYGLRKPRDQVRSSLRCVSDLFVMGACLILESMVLFHWAQRFGLGPVGITGISMGGHMASLAASVWPHPIPLIPCLSTISASYVFTSGIMSASIDWQLLEKQYVSDNVYRDELRKMVRVFDFDDSVEPAVTTASAMASFSRSKAAILSDSAQLSAGSTGLWSSAANSMVQSKSKLLTRQTAPPPPPPLPPFSSSPTHRQRSPPTLAPPPLSAPPLSPVLSATRRPIDTGAVTFMRALMDECTHLANYPAPVDSQLTITVQARADAYVPLLSDGAFRRVWPQCTVRHVPHGHVGAYLLNQNVFRQAIRDAFDRMINKYNI